MELILTAVKREDGLYHFNHSHNDTVEELLMNGTEEVLDHHYYFLTHKFPISGDEIEIILNEEEIKDYDTLLIKELEDAEGTTYMDTTLCIPVWLCPWLEGYFGYRPDEIYIKLKPINKGLEAFKKRTRPLSKLAQ
jgi:hypothetical protein